MAFYLLHNYMDFIEYIGVNSIEVVSERTHEFIHGVNHASDDLHCTQ